MVESKCIQQFRKLVKESGKGGKLMGWGVGGKINEIYYGDSKVGTLVPTVDSLSYLDLRRRRRDSSSETSGFSKSGATQF